MSCLPQPKGQIIVGFIHINAAKMLTGGHKPSSLANGKAHSVCPKGAGVGAGVGPGVGPEGKGSQNSFLGG